MSHSPFPWSEGETFVFDASGQAICREYSHNLNWKDDRSLIAAIPEMVRTLEGFLVDADGEDADDGCELCDGCGEVSAMTPRSDRDNVGCPACIERAHSRSARAVLKKVKKP